MARTKDEAQVKFIADTSGFTEGIKRCNTTLTGLRSELRLNDAQMEGAGRTTDLLTQRQQLLARELEAAGEKVAFTGKQLEKAREIYGQGSAQVQTYARRLTEAQTQEQAIRNALEQTNQELKNQKTSWDQLGDSMDTAGGKLSAAGDKLTEAGKTASAVSAGIVAAGVASVKMADDLTTAVNQYLSATGTAATGTKTLADGTLEAIDNTEKFRGLIRDIYENNYGESYGDIGDALAQIRTQIGPVCDEWDSSKLQAFTESVLALRDTFGYDITEVVRSADTLMNQFNLDGQAALNLILQGAQNGLDYSGELLDSINEYSVQFAKLGLDADDMFAVFASGAQNGAFNLDKVGDAVKELSLRVVDGSDTTRQGFEALGLDADEMAAKFAAGGDTAKGAFEQVISGLAGMEDPLARNTAGVNLFGTLWEDLGGDVITALSTTNSAISATSDAMDQLKGQRYDDLKSQISTLGRTFLSEVAVPLGEQVIPVVSNLVERLGGAVTKFSGWFSGLTEGQKQVILVVGLVVAAVGPLLVILGTVISSVGTIVSFVGTLIPLLGAAAGAIGAISAPVLIVAGVIAALIAVGVLLYQNWDTIREKAGALKDKVLGVWTGIKTGISNTVGAIVSFVTSKFEAVKYAVTHPIETAQDLVGAAIDKIKGFFNITLKFSGIKLPHISIGWKTDGVIASAAKLLGLRGVPQFSVQWYAKGGVLTRPTLFGASGGSLLAGGEAGPEAVAPISVLQGYVAQAVHSSLGTARLEALISAVERVADREVAIYLDSRKLATASAGSYDTVNGRRMALQSRGVAL